MVKTEFGKIKQPYELERLIRTDEPPTMYDAVHHPEHYASGNVECIDWIAVGLTPEEFKGYLKGNMLKYLWRHEHKGKPKEDLEKCRWYLDKLISLQEDA